jgi:hypothetical protein
MQFRLKQLIGDLYWEYDRMSSSGKQTLDKISKLLGLPTEEEMNTKCNIKKRL